MEKVVEALKAARHTIVENWPDADEELAEQAQATLDKIEEALGELENATI